MKRFARFREKATPGRLLDAGLITGSLILSFGIQIGNLGLYQDDWSIVFSSEIASNTPYLERQLQSILINLAGLQPAIYHLITFVLLFIIGLLIYSILIQIGMDRISAIASAMLFELYPGFLQPVSGLQLLGLLTGFIFLLLSLLFYLKWQMTTARGMRYLILGIISSILSILISPLSAALACFTFIFIFNWKRNNYKRIESYILGLILFFSGLFIVQRFSTGKGVLSANIVIQTIKIWLDSFLISWRQILALPQNGRETLIILLYMLFAVSILFWIFRKLEKYPDQIDEMSNSKNNIFNITIMACCAVAGIGYIFLLVVSGYKLEIRYPNDIPMASIGALASIIVVLGIKLLFLPKYRLAILVILIVLAGGAKFSIINRYVVENARVEDLLAQMSVRGDYFQSGLVLISEQLPFNYTSEKTIDALLKIRFNNDNENRKVSYISADNQELREFIHNSTANKTELRVDTNPVDIEKTNLIGFWFRADSCMQILDEKSELSELPQELKLVASISKPELFKLSNLSDVKQLERFRNKIENDWCFYFQLANRQVAEGNWHDVIETYSNAEKQGLTPQVLSDFLPILHASLSENLFSRSLEISREFVTQPEQKGIICYYWKNYQTRSNLSEEEKTEVKKAQIVLGCP